MSKASKLIDMLEDGEETSPIANSLLPGEVSMSGDPRHTHTRELDHEGNGKLTHASDGEPHDHDVLAWEVSPAGSYPHIHLVSKMPAGPCLSADDVNPVSEGDKLVGDEAEAAGYYFGISNLGLDHPSIRGYKKYSEFVTKNAPNWKKIKSELSQQLNHYMESDDMLDQAMDEINDWIKQAKQGDSYVVGEWKKIVAGKAESLSEQDQEWDDEVSDTKEKVKVSTSKTEPTVRRVFKDNKYLGSYDLKKADQSTKYKSMFKGAK